MRSARPGCACRSPGDGRVRESNWHEVFINSQVFSRRAGLLGSFATLVG
ncbi:MAG TPA: hypothetical protein PLJ25_06575 [Methanothrix sp.]|nr:hypothetical protein [Methanothrix sp.]